MLDDIIWVIAYIVAYFPIWGTALAIWKYESDQKKRKRK